MANNCVDLGQRQNLPRITILTTGGTIAGQSDSRPGHGYIAGGLTGRQLIDCVPELGRIATLHVEPISDIGSQDMNDAIWSDLRNRIESICQHNQADGIVITHGTDTLEETAFFLDSVMRPAVPLVLTAAMRPADTPEADGPGNLLSAVRVACNRLSQGRSVLVVMDRTIYDPRWLTKTHTCAIAAFDAPGFGPIGRVDDAGVRYFAPISSRPLLATNAPLPLPHVAIVYAYAGMGIESIEHAVQDGARGIVLAGLGNGNTSKPVLAALNRASRQGVAVVRATRVFAGPVQRNIEVDDDASGFIVAGAFRPPQARLALALLIACGVADAHALQQAFDSLAVLY